MIPKKRGNPNWGKPMMNTLPPVLEFERVAREFKLSPDQYQHSTRLREWASVHRKSNYIPEVLLKAWGFEIESSL